MKILPIRLDDLIHKRSVESIRIEFKKSWSKPTLEQVVRTICAFANDFFNLNGGYIVIGIEEKDGRALLPPAGVDAENLDDMQKEIRGQCKRIDPEYQPLVSPEIFMDKQILVIWVPAGDLRPYQAPRRLDGKHRSYFIRASSQTVEAQGSNLTQLMQSTAKVPFDDRRNHSASVEMISPALVRNFLANINSDLVAPDVTIRDEELNRLLRITVRVNDHEVPKNVALLFFVNNPDDHFPGARIEVVQFGDDAGGNLIEEKIFRGPVDVQIRQTLDFLNTLSTTMVRKIPGRRKHIKTSPFPVRRWKRRWSMRSIIEAMKPRNRLKSTSIPIAWK